MDAEGGFARKFYCVTEKLNFLVASALDRGVTCSMQIGQKYCVDETLFLVSFCVSSPALYFDARVGLASNC